MSAVMHSLNLDEDADGWTFPRCDCGWVGPPVPDDEIAGDIFAEHKLAAAGGEQGVQTPLRLHEAEDWPVSNRTRRVGWLDQRGRVWTAIPAQADRPADVGSFTPLLIELDD